MMMTRIPKNCVCLFVAVGLFYFSTARAQIYVESGSSSAIIVDNTEIILDVAPATRGGELFVPLTDDLAAVLGAEFEYYDDGGRAAAKVTMPGASLSFTEGAAVYSSGSVEKALRGAPFMLGPWLAVPAAVLFQEIGYDAEFADGNKFVSKKSRSAFVEQIPELLFLPEAEPTKIEEPEKAAVEPEAAPARKPAPFQYTYENSFEYKNNKISGDAAKSSIQPESDGYNKFNLRAVGELANGYGISAALRTSSTTNGDFRQGEVNSLTVDATRGNTLLKFYDLNPKISRFVMRNYQMQGFQYGRTSGGITTSVMIGRTPKRLYESLYTRNVIAARVEKRAGAAWRYSATHARIDDVRYPEITDRHENSVTTFTVGYDTKPFNVSVERAMSADRVFHGESRRADATRIDVKRMARNLMFIGNYEQIGNEFVSETAFFTPGRREFSAFVSARLNPRTTATTGGKSVLYLGENTETIPFQISSQPFAARKKMKLAMNLSNEKARNSTGSKLTESRQFSVSDWFGGTKLALNFDRRVQKSYQGELNFRTNFKAQATSKLTDRLTGTFQFRQEKRNPNQTPISRFYRARLEYELKEWNDVGLTFERYYNGTEYDRNCVEADYRLLDNINDSEIAITYGFHNYAAHNENRIGLKYSYVR